MSRLYVPKVGDPVRVALSGTVSNLDAYDQCIQINTGDGWGFAHYIYAEDPNIQVMLQTQSVPPHQDDVWFIGNHVWHADANKNLVRVSRTANGRLAFTRSFDTALHSTTRPPELLFRFRV